MPGYARPTTTVLSTEVVTQPTGDISATSLQPALAEIASEKAQITYVDQQINTKSKSTYSVSAPILPKTGDIWTNTTTGIAYTWSGTDWVAIGSAGGGLESIFLFGGI